MSQSGVTPADARPVDASPTEASQTAWTTWRAGRWMLLVGGLSIVVFGALVLWHYHMKPTPAALFLWLGWASVVAFGALLGAAVRSFDLQVSTQPLVVLPGTQAKQDLEREKRWLLKAIQEITFDLDTGKVDSDVADAAIEKYRARAVQVLKQLDQLTPKLMEARVAAELERRMSAGASPSQTGAPQVADQASPGPSDVGTFAGACAGCGTTNDVDATFCKKCGQRLGADS